MTNRSAQCDCEQIGARQTLAYLCLGSNLGDREANLREAIDRIKSIGLSVVRCSSVFETEPVGLRDQPWFLNQVIAVQLAAATGSAQAGALLRALLDIEQRMGRKRSAPNGPRIIDIDLLIYDQMAEPIVEGTWLIVPHPRLHLRRFVLEPLCEIAPDLVHPVLKKTCRQILAALNDNPIVRVYSS
jgi:2-amino-4-hydroxy-6-hydroxymethyldihydropteridine diphosphokinase